VDRVTETAVLGDGFQYGRGFDQEAFDAVETQLGDRIVDGHAQAVMEMTGQGPSGGGHVVGDLLDIEVLVQVLGDEAQSASHQLVIDHEGVARLARDQRHRCQPDRPARFWCTVHQRVQQFSRTVADALEAVVDARQGRRGRGVDQDFVAGPDERD
jgi:hypothetical protein